MSILEVDMLSGNYRVAYKQGGVKLLPVHINGAYLVIVVGGVVIHARVGVAAGGVERQLAGAVLQHAAAPLLRRRAQMRKEVR